MDLQELLDNYLEYLFELGHDLPQECDLYKIKKELENSYYKVCDWLIWFNQSGCYPEHEQMLRAVSIYTYDKLFEGAFTQDSTVVEIEKLKQRNSFNYLKCICKNGGCGC